MNQPPEFSDRMDIGRLQVGTVYAKALLGAGHGGSGTDLVLDELGELLTGVFPKVPQFAQTLAAPRVPVSEKNAMLEQVLKGRVSDELLRFLKVVSERGRMDCLREIYHSARALRNAQLGVAEVYLTTATPLPEATLESIRDTLAARMNCRIELRTALKPALIGGFVIRVGDQVFDASVAQQLKSLRAESVASAVQQIRSHSDQFAISS